jgi:putative ABC transport system ATP-binding protein
MDNGWIKTVELCRFYRRGDYIVRAAADIAISIQKGEFVAIVGASGSGKSTLLNLLAGLDTPTSGFIEIEGTKLSSLTRRQLSAYRAEKVGMIFQSFNLLSNQTALKNVEMPLYFSKTPRKERRKKAADILEQLGMGERMEHKPTDLSGGEQQRVAIARALVKNPEILFADEPTGNLDEDNSAAINDLLLKLNDDGLTIVMVTHDVETANKIARRRLKMSYGKIVEDTVLPGNSLL